MKVKDLLRVVDIRYCDSAKICRDDYVLLAWLSLDDPTLNRYYERRIRKFVRLKDVLWICVER